MVILVTPMTHGPHLWYSAMMWYFGGQFIDLFRVREWRRPDAQNILSGPNEYHFSPA